MDRVELSVSASQKCMNERPKKKIFSSCCNVNYDNYLSSQEQGKNIFMATALIYEATLTELSKVRRSISRAKGALRDTKDRIDCLIGDDEATEEVRAMLEAKEAELVLIIENGKVEIEQLNNQIQVLMDQQVQRRSPSPRFSNASRGDDVQVTPHEGSMEPVLRQSGDPTDSEFHSASPRAVTPRAGGLLAAVRHLIATPFMGRRTAAPKIEGVPQTTVLASDTEEAPPRLSNWTTSAEPSAKPVARVGELPPLPLKRAPSYSSSEAAGGMAPRMIEANTDKKDLLPMLAKPVGPASWKGSKFELPKLRDPGLLASHLGRVDEVLIEHEWATRVDMTVHYRTSPTLINKITESLSQCESIYKMALRLLDSLDHQNNWGVLRTELLQKLCNRQALRAELNQRMKLLVLKSVKSTEVEEFILTTEETYSSYTRIYSDDAEGRLFKRQLLSQLPHSIQQTVHLQLRLSTGIFEEIEVIDLRTILRMIRLCASTVESLTQPDRARAVEVSGKPAPRPFEFVKRFKTAFVIFAKKHLTKDMIKGAEDLLKIPGKKEPWYIVGCGGDMTLSKLQTVLQDVDKFAKARIWEDRSKNPSPPATNQSTSQAVFAVTQDSVNRIEEAKTSEPSQQHEAVCQLVPSLVAPPPIRLRATVENGPGAGAPVSLIVDSGAGFSYITLGHNSPLRGLCEEAPTMIEMADGTARQLTQRLTLAVVIESCEGRGLGPFDLQMHVLKTNGVDGDMILLGRQDMLNLKIDIQAAADGLKCLIENECVFTGYALDFEPATAAVAINRIEAIEPEAASAVQRLAGRGWFPVPGCEGFEIRLRPLKSNESKDQEAQSHVWEVALPAAAQESQSATAKGPSYERTLYERLNSQRKQEYDDLAVKYKSQGWWFSEIPAHLHDNLSLLPSAPVFLTLSGHDDQNKAKARLVCDLREANVPFVCSSSTSATSEMINQLRLAGPSVIISGDIEQAFYHVKLHKTLVQLNLGDGSRVFSDRMTFGLAFGTGTLDGVIQAMRSELQPECWVKSFVDDYVIACTPLGLKAVVSTFSTWLSLLALTGFNTNLKKFSVLALDSLKAGLTQVAEARGLAHVFTDASLRQTITILGTEFSMDDSAKQLKASCVANLEQVGSLLATWYQHRRLTKKQYFQIAGGLGFDATHSHAEGRAIADGIRRVIGTCNFFKENLKQGWDSVVQMDQLPKQHLANLEILMKWASTYTSSRIKNKCCHRTPLNHDTPVDVIVACDASHVGGGYVISVRYNDKLSILCESSWLWPKRFVGNHSNLKELRALHKTLVTVGSLMDTENATLARKRLGKIVLLSDNIATVAWATPSPGATRSRRSNCLMRRSLFRLIEAIREEKHFLYQYATVVIQHVKGANNEQADAHSRFYHQLNLGIQLQSDTEEDQQIPELRDDLFMQINEDLKDEVADAVNATEAVAADAEADPLTELLARESRTVDGFYSKFHWLKNVIRAWKSSREVVEELPPVSFEEGQQAALKAVQLSIENRQGLLNNAFKEDSSGLICLVDHNYQGARVERPYIPKAAIQFRNLVIRDTHKQHGHCSCDNIVARLRELFFIPALRSQTKYHTHTCITCQREAARRHTVEADHGTTRDSVKDPYEEAQVDIVFIHSEWKVLTITCRSTGHTTWTTVKSEKAGDVVSAMAKAALICGTPQKVFSDSAAYFRSTTMQKYFAEHHRYSPYSPWESGVSETLHKLGLQIVRKCLSDVCRRGGPRDALSREWLLRRVCLLLNTRPLQIRADVVITPDYLALGHTRQVAPGFLGRKLGPKVDARELRAQFARLYVSGIRDRSVLGMANGRETPKWKPEIGQKVLLYHPTAEKDRPDWEIAKVIEVLTRRVVVERRGKAQTVNISNIAPLQF